MRLIFLMFALICFSSCAALRTKDLCYLDAQRGMAGTAKEQYEEFDKDLNYVCGKSIVYLSRLDDNFASLRRLVYAEELWERYRDVQCEAITEFYRGSPMLPTVKYSCLRDVTRQRIFSLIAAYEDRDNLVGGPIFEIDRQKYFKEEGKEKEEENQEEVSIPDDGHFQSQWEMNMIADEAARKSYKELNDICGEIIEFLSQDVDNDEAKQKFIYAQGMWEKYRDADSKAANGLFYEGGTMYTMVNSYWLAAETNVRIHFLKSAYCEIWEKRSISEP